MTATSFQLPHTDTVVYGAGAFDNLSAQIERLEVRRVMVILSGSLAGGPVETRLRATIGHRIAGLFSRTRQHVPRSSVLAATQTARDNDADCILSIGGGTPIDCGKAVALALSTGIINRHQFEDYRVRYTHPDMVIPVIPTDFVPHIAIPTTLSGGEHTHLAGVTNEATKNKNMYLHSGLQPRVVILDPEITAATPAWLWAASGMRAVDHAIEGMLSIRHTPVTDALGTKALSLIRDNLAHSAKHPEDLDARTNCLLATWLSIFAHDNVGSGLSHGIGHQLAAEFDMVHGVTSAIMLPHVIDYVGEFAGPRILDIATALGADTSDLDPKAAAAQAAALVRELVSTLNVPNTISGAGGTREAFPKIADHVIADAALASCPRAITREEVIDLLRTAW